MTTVVNIYKEPYDVYIGRAGKQLDGYFGNPFKYGSRYKNVEDFQKYFIERMESDEEYYKRIHALRGKRLGCFCHPQYCHGDIIADYLNQSYPEAL